MTDNERWELYKSADFHQMVSVKLLDWAGYWANAGVDEIEDGLLREQTRRAINVVINDLDATTDIVKSLAISADAIKEVSADSLTPEIVDAVIVSIMARELEFVTGVIQS